MSIHTQAAEVLHLAATDIEKNGLARGEAENAQGQHCSIGAIVAAWCRTSSNHLVKNQAWEALATASGLAHYCEISAWSDKAPEPDVIAAFRLAEKAELRLADEAGE